MCIQLCVFYSILPPLHITYLEEFENNIMDALVRIEVREDDINGLIKAIYNVIQNQR